MKISRINLNGERDNFSGIKFVNSREIKNLLVALGGDIVEAKEDDVFFSYKGSYNSLETFILHTMPEEFKHYLLQVLNRGNVIGTFNEKESLLNATPYIKIEELLDALSDLGAYLRKGKVFITSEFRNLSKNDFDGYDYVFIINHRWLDVPLIEESLRKIKGEY